MAMMRLGCSCALTILLAACGAADEADGVPTYGGSLTPFPSGGSSGASASPNGQNPSAPNNSLAGSPSQTNPPSPSAAGANGTGGASSNTPQASGGSSGTATGGAPTTPDPTLPPPTNPPPTTPIAPDIACPSGAIFCSGFEGTAFPAGTRFEPDYLAAAALGTEMTLDTNVFRSGQKSLHMPVGSNYYRMLSVAVPTTFWVRLYTRSNVGFGAMGSTHASLFMGSIVAPGGDYNADRAVEVAEQFGQVLLNVKDSLYGTSGTNPNGQPGTRLPNDTWTCMEALFDGASGDVQIFVEGDLIIDASGWQPPTAYQSFRFGYLRFDSPARDVWMDDVIVATERVGCQ
jgi:hypothetical protein